MNWSKEDIEASWAEGWTLTDYDHSGFHEIQKLDTAETFESDWDAFRHVCVAAEQGSELHQRALAIHECDEAAVEQVRRRNAAVNTLVS
jgi:hypothetical protein